MKIPINLASQPYRRDRAIIAASVAVSVLLVFTLGILILLIVQDRAQLADVRADVNHLNQQTRIVNAQQAQLDTVLRQPENAEVIERSVFLNSLLVRKGISWTRVFADLEKTLPYSVKLMQVRPTVDSQNHVRLDMTVGANEPGPLIEMFKAFKESPLFGDAEMQSNLPPTQSEPLYRLKVMVPYAQKL
jgi:Tfp pilus assembly protein PilN